ncbi:MAG: hypothetical protein RL376_1323, partial [Verrucomicrobiota bacterium]
MHTLRKLMSEFAVIIVTGGSSGIGKAFIEHAQKLSETVVICNLSRREPDIIFSQLKSCHVPVDLGNSSALAAAADQVLRLVAAAPAGKV